MNCPYCAITFSLEGVNAQHTHLLFSRIPFHGGQGYREEKRDETDYSISCHRCPECKKQIIWLNEVRTKMVNDANYIEVIGTTLLFPKYPIKQIPGEIPEKFARDFQETHDTLSVSLKASAALSRRCLQNLIREQEGIVEKNLFGEVDKLVKLNKLPKYLADDLDAIRQIGNFAAHPVKDSNTGEIVDVEPGEAEWTFKVLEDLLLFYFVEEPKSAARRAALNRKLKDAGKGPMLKSS